MLSSKMSLQQNTKCKLSLLLWLNEEDDPKKVFFSTIIFSSAASKKTDNIRCPGGFYINRRAKKLLPLSAHSSEIVIRARKILYFINKWKWAVSFWEIVFKLRWQVLRRFNSHLNQMSSPGTSTKLHKIDRSLYWYNKIWKISEAISWLTINWTANGFSSGLPYRWIMAAKIHSQ